MHTRHEVQQFAATTLQGAKLPYVGQLPDGTHVLAANKARVLVRETKQGLLAMQVLATGNGKR